MHVVDIAVDFIHMWHEGYLVCFIQSAVRIIFQSQNWALLDLTIMEVVDVLSDKDWFHICLLHTILLKLGNCFVTCVHLFVSCKLDKIPVPLPVGHWVLIEKRASQNLGRVIFVKVPLALLPEAILTTEGRDATCCADACSRHHSDLLAPYQVFGSLLSCQLLGLILVTLWLFEATTE